jgi:hypothetical protein
MKDRVDYSRENGFLAIAMVAVAAFYFVSYHYHQARERSAPRRLAERIVDPDQKYDDGASYDASRPNADSSPPESRARIPML